MGDCIYGPTLDALQATNSPVVEYSLPSVATAENALDGSCLATPAIADGMIFFRTQGHLLAFGRTVQLAANDQP
jgi:hypothetical protein